MSQALEITAANFGAEVLKSPLPVLVDFYATWCGPCQNMAPILDTLAEQWGDKIKIVKINTEDPANAEITMQYKIQSIPNFKVFKAGTMVKEIIGFHVLEELQDELKDII